MVDLSGQAVVAILTRAPSAGGKSRLFRALGRPVDPALLRALLLDTLEAIPRDRVTRVICYTPPAAAAEMETLAPPGVGAIAQRDGDLGARMRGVFDDLFARGAALVIAIGSDLPALTADIIGQACDVLSERPDAVVLGPAADGGYYLVGATRTPSRVFDGIPWSTPAVLAETEKAAARAHLQIVRLPTLFDVDTPDDLRRAAQTPAATRTRAWWRSHEH